MYELELRVFMDHKNTLPTVDILCGDETVYIVMPKMQLNLYELCIKDTPGPPLRSVLAVNDEPSIRAIMKQVLQGMQYLHDYKNHSSIYEARQRAHKLATLPH